MSVYDPAAFEERVAFAARQIGSGRPSTWHLDTCFEMSDGDAVAVALVRRISARPNTRLARNFERYLGESAYEAAQKYRDLPTALLPRLSAQLIRAANERYAAERADEAAKRASAAATDGAVQ